MKLTNYVLKIAFRRKDNHFSLCCCVIHVTRHLRLQNRGRKIYSKFCLKIVVWKTYEFREFAVISKDKIKTHLQLNRSYDRLRIGLQGTRPR